MKNFIFAILLMTIAGVSCAAETPFTGTLKFHQKDGKLTYYVTVKKGRIVSGHQDFGDGKATANIVGGWYDGEHLATLIQMNGYDTKDKWFSHLSHFKKDGDNFVLEETLYGYKKTINDGGVYTLHAIDNITEE